MEASEFDEFLEVAADSHVKGRSRAETANELLELPQAVRDRFARELQQAAHEVGMDEAE